MSHGLESQSDMEELANEKLVRGMGLPGAVSANMLNMIGIGPFITLGPMISLMGGPQAILGWILGAVISLCDGLVYAELGAAMPGAGGAYVYFRHAFGPKWGHRMSFLFLWEMLFVGPLGIAAACVGFADYAHFLLPHLTHAGVTVLAMGACIAVTILLYRPIKSVGSISILIMGVVLLAMMWISYGGMSHLNPHLAFDYPARAFRPSKAFYRGLAAATLFAMYNYGGYNNITYLGAEVRNPMRNIPRAVNLSIALVAILYVLMSLSVLGTIPWREAAQSQAVISEFIGRLYGSNASMVMTILIQIATFGGIFALSLGYSRVLYAAGANGDFFSMFGKVHRSGRFPTVALLALNGAALVLCGFAVERLIMAQMVIQIVFQFIPQVIAVFTLRKFHPGVVLPYRMWFYPIPALIALAGWIYVVSTPQQVKYLGSTILLLLCGLAVYSLRNRKAAEALVTDK